MGWLMVFSFCPLCCNSRKIPSVTNSSYHYFFDDRKYMSAFHYVDNVRFISHPTGGCISEITLEKIYFLFVLFSSLTCISIDRVDVASSFSLDQINGPSFDCSFAFILSSSSLGHFSHL